MSLAVEASSVITMAVMAMTKDFIAGIPSFAGFELLLILGDYVLFVCAWW